MTLLKLFHFHTTTKNIFLNFQVLISNQMKAKICNKQINNKNQKEKNRKPKMKKHRNKTRQKRKKLKKITQIHKRNQKRFARKHRTEI